LSSWLGKTSGWLVYALKYVVWQAPLLLMFYPDQFALRLV
jgi:hypothetical protein